ncbi:MAG TPA: hypothetical protein DEB40_06315 [Elusimicrobia bacterium]|nr:hypothetical protein [Elusimicrobiota bacterium]
MIFASCIDSRGVIMAHSDPSAGGRAIPAGALRHRLNADGAKKYSYTDPRSRRVIEWDAPVFLGAARMGLAQVAYDEDAFKDDLRLKLRATVRQSIMVASCTFLLALFFGLTLAWSLSRPIGLLVQAARAIGEGDLDYQTPTVDRKDELGYLAHEMNRMAQQLKSIDELKNDLINQVSHDLRSPMAAIRMYAEFLLHTDPDRDKMTPRHKEMLTIITDNAMRLNVFVSNILDAAKMKAGRMQYHIEPVALGPIAQNVISLFRILAFRHNIQLASEIPEDIPAVNADSERLEQVLANLVGNALRFTRVGGRVAIGARMSERQVEVRVSDTGLGMSQDAVSKLFKRFSQADLARQRAEGIHGTGLGLFIVKQAVDAMGGRVWIESEEGKGTRVFLLLPVADGGAHVKIPEIS